MRYQSEYLEGIFTRKHSDEFVFFDSCVLMAEDRELSKIKYIYRVLGSHQNWFVTPGVRKEYEEGIRGLKKGVHSVKGRHAFDIKEYVPLKNTLLSKDIIQARERVLSLMGKEAHDPFNERHLAPKTVMNYRDLVPKVRGLFSNYAGEVHATDIDLISICLAHALDGRKVILASNDHNLTRTFCEGSRNLSHGIQNGRGPKIPVYEGENRFFDYAHMNYRH